MATRKINVESNHVTIVQDHEGRRLRVHTGDIPMFKADHDSNTFIIERLELDRDGLYEVRDDLLRIDELPVPYGQFCFLLYEGDGEFLSWCGSYECDTGKICSAMKLFGYETSVLSPMSFKVDEKSKFTLKLKYGY